MSEQTTVVGFSQQLIGFLTASHPTLAADFGNDINSIAVYTANIDEFRNIYFSYFHPPCVHELNNTSEKTFINVVEENN